MPLAAGPLASADRKVVSLRKHSSLCAIQSSHERAQEAPWAMRQLWVKAVYVLRVVEFLWPLSSAHDSFP